MAYTSLALKHDATVRFGDAVCTEGAFDLQEEKYRAVLQTSAPVGLRALRDRRLITLAQSASATGGSAAANMDRLASSDDVPVSANVLKFSQGPSVFQKKKVSRVPSRNRAELERISQLMKLDEEDAQHDRNHPDDDAALLRTAMVDAKKRQRAVAAATATAALLGTPGYLTTKPTEVEEEFIGMVSDSIPQLLGSRCVRLFGIVTAVDKTTATVQVWRKGGTVFTERRPLEKLPLQSLQKLTTREFALVCNKPLVTHADERTRKQQSGAVSTEDMPATLMSHTNEIVESLIQKMEQTASIQQQAVAEELAQQNSSFASTPQHRHHHHKKTGGDGGRERTLTPPPSHMTPQHRHQHHNHHDNINTPGSASSAIHSLRRSAGTPKPTQKTLSVLGDHLGLGSGIVKLGVDRNKMRGSSLRERHNVSRSQILSADSPLLRQYHAGTNCGVAVLRSLPEPPMTRLIDPLVDVREEFRALSVMSSSFKPQSEYIRSLQRVDNRVGGGGKSDSKGGVGGGDADASLPVLGTQRPRSGALSPSSQNNNASSSAGGGGGGGARSPAVVTGVESGVKLPPPTPSFIENAVNEARHATRASPAESVSAAAAAAAAASVMTLLHHQHPNYNTSSATGGISGLFQSNNSASLFMSSDFSGVHVSQQQHQHNHVTKRRVAQPVPPCLLYSSYPADADQLPPELPCTVLEYRKSSQTLLLNVRRVGGGLTTGSSAGGGSGSGAKSDSSRPSSSSPASTGRSGPGGATGGDNNSGRSAGATGGGVTNSSPKEATQKLAKKRQDQWRAATNGLSTILVRCAFVDVTTVSEAELLDRQQESSQLEGANNYNSIKSPVDPAIDPISGPPSPTPPMGAVQRSQSGSDFQRSPSSSYLQHRASASSRVAAAAATATAAATRDDHHHQHQNNNNNNRPTSAALSAQSHPQSQASGSAAALLGAGGGVAYDGDSYLAALVGKQIDVIPLWATCIDNEHACVADIQRGDLSILDEMVSSKFATISSAAQTEYERLRAEFGPQQFRGQSFWKGSTGQAPVQDEYAVPAHMAREMSMNTAALTRFKSSYFSPSAARQLLESDPELIIDAAESFLGRRVFRLLEAQSPHQQKKQQQQQQYSQKRSGTPTTTIQPVAFAGIEREASVEICSTTSDDGSGSSPLLSPNGTTGARSLETSLNPQPSNNSSPGSPQELSQTQTL